MLKATLNLRCLMAAAHCVSTEETRYYLNGVCVEIRPQSVTYIATDGHALFAAYDPVPRKQGVDAKGKQSDCGRGEDHTLVETLIIPSSTLKLVKLPKARKGSTPTFNATLSEASPGSKARTLTLPDGGAVTFEPIDGSFPDWRRVVPNEANSPSSHMFNPAIVARVWNAFATLTGNKDSKPGMAYNGDGPAMLSLPDVDAIGLVMPLRNACGACKRAGWIDNPADFANFDKPKGKGKGKAFSGVVEAAPVEAQPEPVKAPEPVEAPKPVKPRLSYAEWQAMKAAA